MSFGEFEPVYGDITIVQRELRRIPQSWHHPTLESGEYRPLQRRDYRFTEEEVAGLLEDGTYSSLEEIEALYMPDFSGTPEDEMGACIYETKTEGTPLSPIYPDTVDGLYNLLAYASENLTISGERRANIGTWAVILLRTLGQVALDHRTGDTIDLTPPTKELEPDARVRFRERLQKGDVVYFVEREHFGESGPLLVKKASVYSTTLPSGAPRRYPEVIRWGSLDEDPGSSGYSVTLSPRELFTPHEAKELVSASGQLTLEPETTIDHLLAEPTSNQVLVSILGGEAIQRLLEDELRNPGNPEY